jgi:uncharacterized protein (DUF2267 family)
MSALGLPILDKAVQDTNIWLGELMAALGWDDRNRAYRLLRSALHAVRDRLSVNEAAQLAAQLPLIVRGVFFDGWRPAGVPTRVKHADDFIATIEHAFRQDPNADPEAAVRAALAVIASHVAKGEIDDVKSGMPPGIRALWP